MNWSPEETQRLSSDQYWPKISSYSPSEKAEGDLSPFWCANAQRFQTERRSTAAKIPKRRVGLQIKEIFVVFAGTVVVVVM